MLFPTKSTCGQDPLNCPIKLNNKIASLSGIVASSDFAPTDGAYEVSGALCIELDVYLKVLDKVVAEDVIAFNRLMEKQPICGDCS